MSVIEQPLRSLTKNSENAPALGVAIPCRKRSPVEFWMTIFQMLPPLNVKIGYLIQKGDEAHVKDGKLPAAARNALIERALMAGMKFLFFVDDDVMFPEITLYRMWVSMQKHPEVACITAVGGTKLTPCEPLIYQEGVQGAWWDWQLGAQIPIESAWAGCMMVNLDYVRKMKDPWFNDQVVGPEVDTGERAKLNIFGHDRYFHVRLKQDAGGIVVADTGLLCAHFDADRQKAYILAPDSPPFKRDILGETWFPFFGDDGTLHFRQVYMVDRPDRSFNSYLDWLKTQEPKHEKEPITLIPTEVPSLKERKTVKVEQKEGFTVQDSRKVDFSEWLKEVGAKHD